MHTSGIMIMPIRDRYDDCHSRVDALDGVEIATGDRSLNKIVAVLETRSVKGQEELLRTIQGLESVAVAELVCHHFGEEAGQDPASS